MSLRGKVLGSYRLLLRACQNLCRDDLVALNRARAAIKEEYNKHGTVENEQEIEEWVGRAVDAEKYVETSCGTGRSCQ
ncbi:hypothetical protein GBAR_LOCUS17953 [Geodia barretti]|uniref:Uncharacterized protein n=1 Tax=Geodia barretti TaxID=519541 RepID=A0AA35WS03_GEOBA|nr:hypothetical protein GBAR_LOCUS17953 [Geodia barretti]